MILLPVVISVIAVAVLYWLYFFHDKRQKLRWMPGEEGFPVIGKVLEWKENKELNNVFGRYTRKHNGLCWMSIFSTPKIIATDYKYVEFILTSTEMLDKSEIYDYLLNWLGVGLLTAGGSKWKNMRKILTPAFHFTILEQFIPVFETNLETLVRLLREESKKGVVNVSPFITMCALDIICETSMGVKMDAQINNESEYVKSVKKMCQLVLKRIKSLFGRFNLTYPLYSIYYEEKNRVKFLHSYTDNVINQRREELECETAETENDDLGRKKKMAFLDLMLKTKVNGNHLPHKVIRDQVNTFMFAGHDTTTAAISAAIYCLANHPDVQEKALEEQKLIFGEEYDRPSTYRDLQEMKYLEKVIKETLRLYPSVPFIGRRSNKDVQYEEGKIIPAGVETIIFIYGINRNPEVFPEPEKFNPERFESSSGLPPYSYLPFSAGPRNCIGQKFGMLEIKATISKLLRNFHIRPPGPGYDPIFTSELVLYSTNGINVVLEERNVCK